MRHGDKIKNLGRKKAHRDALLSNLACQLITHKRIITTVAKAKALRVYVEPLITKNKEKKELREQDVDVEAQRKLLKKNPELKKQKQKQQPKNENSTISFHMGSRQVGTFFMNWSENLKLLALMWRIISF